MWVVIGWVASECSGKQGCHIGAQLMDGRHHDVRRTLLVELLYAFAKVGFIDLYAMFAKIFAHTAFVHKHGFSFGHSLHSMCTKYVEHYRVVFCGICCPMHMYAVGSGVAFEFFKIFIKPRECMPFDIGCEGTHLLPLGDCRGNIIASHSGRPQASVVALAVGCVFYKSFSELYLIDLSHGLASPFSSSVM